jgi:hypothetical protein
MAKPASRQPPSTTKEARMSAEHRRAGKTATEALKILWEEGLFTSWQKKRSINDSLDERGNHFSDAELGMALMRARHLTRRGKRGSYEYIQKYPYRTEEMSVPKVKRHSND